MYDEKPLKKGMMYLYKEVKKEVPSFSYLIKIIENGIEEQEFDIKVMKDKTVGYEKMEKLSKEVRESEEAENPLLLAYSKMPKAIQDMLLDQAKDLYMKDVNIKKMNVTHEKFFKAAQKSYIKKDRFQVEEKVLKISDELLKTRKINILEAISDKGDYLEIHDSEEIIIKKTEIDTYIEKLEERGEKNQKLMEGIRTIIIELDKFKKKVSELNGKAGI